MKKLIILFVLAFIAISANAKVWTVSNDPARPAQFSNLQLAHDSAWAGDTILITGSTTYFVNPATNSWLYFKKPLVFIGEGINNGGKETYILYLNLSRVNSSLGADSSKFYGIKIANLTLDPYFSGVSTGQANLTNILFERCYIGNVNFSCYSPGYGIISKITFRNCLFGGQVFPNYSIGFQYGDFSQVLFTNCVFDNFYFAGSGSNYNLNGNVILRNNVFINKSTSLFHQSNTIYGLIIENNIFYQAEPTGAYNSTFNNNITYQCNSNTIPYGTNVGSGNIINAYPKFNNYPQMGGTFSFAYNFGLQSGSPAIGTGTNSTNIGLTGGNGPINNIPGNPKIPIVTNVNIPVSSVPVGGNLQIQINANTRE